MVADRTVYLSGCLGLDPATKQMVAGGAGPETRQALRNMCAILLAAGSGVDRVLKTTVYVADLADYPLVNAEYSAVFTGACPARTCFQVARLPLDGRVEIEAIALVGDAVTELVSVE